MYYVRAEFILPTIQDWLSQDTYGTCKSAINYLDSLVIFQLMI